jgi:hypothetical protein
MTATLGGMAAAAWGACSSATATVGLSSPHKLLPIQHDLKYGQKKKMIREVAYGAGKARAARCLRQPSVSPPRLDDPARGGAAEMGLKTPRFITEIRFMACNQKYCRIEDVPFEYRNQLPKFF